MTLLGVDEYLIALKSPNAHERRNAAWNLGRFRDLRIADALIAALDDPEASVRVRAAESLGAFALDPVVAVLAACVLRDNDMIVRAQALTALGRIHRLTPAVSEALLASLDSDMPEVRAAAAEIAGKLAVPESIAPLVSIFLQDVDEIARYSAGRSLALIGGDAVIDALGKVIDNVLPDLRARIVDVLGATRHPRAVPLLSRLAADADPTVAEAAAWALKDIGKP